MDAFDRLVTVNRLNPPDPIEFCIPLDLAIDKSWCEQASRSITGSGKWTVFAATANLTDHLPEKSGLYMFVWKIPFAFPNDKLVDHFFRMVVYVGQAGAEATGNTLQRRYKQEYASIVAQDPQSLWNADSSNRESRLKRHLNLRDLEFWFHEVGRTDLLLAFETSLIQLFNPPANVQFAKRRATVLSAKIGRAIPAF